MTLWESALSLYAIGSTTVVLWLGFRLTLVTEGIGAAWWSLPIALGLMVVGGYFCISVAGLLCFFDWGG